ncbi:MAG: DegT/DnrJ/EryC1/StrS aminotransferase family protein [Pseudomonadota bacterium]
MSDSVGSELKFRFYRGRVGLAQMLRALGIGDGDEVITQAYTCVAVPEGIMSIGATPVYADILPDHVNLDPSSVEEKISSATRAIIVQHTFGYPAALSRIMSIADRHGIPVIEDCCHTLSSEHQGQRVGTFGVGAFYSFEWGKPIASGVGGAVLLNNDTLVEAMDTQCDSLITPSFVRGLKVQLQYMVFRVLYRPANYWFLKDLFARLSKLKVVEGNYNPISADDPSEEFSFSMLPAVSRRVDARLARLDESTHRALSAAEQVGAVIKEAGYEPPVVDQGDLAVPARIPFAVEDKARLLALARELRTEVAEWYSTPIHPLGANDQHMVGYASGECKVAEAACQSFVSLPVFGVTPRYLDDLATLLQRAKR